jgi:hypothetical protein
MYWAAKPSLQTLEGNLWPQLGFESSDKLSFCLFSKIRFCFGMVLAGIIFSMVLPV